MADNYSYSFDYTSGVFRPSYVSAIGSFSVDYNSMRVYDIKRRVWRYKIYVWNGRIWQKFRWNFII